MTREEKIVKAIEDYCAKNKMSRREIEERAKNSWANPEVEKIVLEAKNAVVSDIIDIIKSTRS